MVLISRLAFAFAAMFLVAAGASGQGSDSLSLDDQPGASAVAETRAIVYDGSEGELAVPTPILVDGGVTVDGRLIEASWSSAALLHGFTQYEPVEGVESSQRTEVLVFRGEDALYLGIRAFDDDASSIRATLGERDEFTRSDDYVRILLDTFNDRRRAYAFTVNPLGAQHDGLWLEGGGGRYGSPIDDNPDFLWESAGRLEPWGYAVELRIPFKSLRFPVAETQAWGLQVMRRIQRTGFESSWAPITGEIANRLSQSGSLRELNDLDPGLFLEINPVVTGKQIGEHRSAAGAFRRDDPAGDFGLNMTYGLTSNLTLDATYNPDFSQIEADAGQISVNERFALFVPEKRPFFLEGTEVFNLQRQLVYTRSIANPVAGAKLTGKVGALNVGYVGALDESFDGGSAAAVNLLRLRRDVGRSSTLGVVYTDRTRSSSTYNRVLGADARVVFGGRYTLDVLGAASTTGREQGSDNGYLVAAELTRSSRSLSFSVGLDDTNRGFAAESGFLRRTGESQVSGRIRRTFRGGPGAFVESVSTSLDLDGVWDHARFWSGESWKEGSASLSGSVSLRNNTSVSVTASRRAFAPLDAEYAGLYSGYEAGSLSPFRPRTAKFDGLNGARLFLSTSAWERLRGRLRLEWRETPLFDRSLGVPVDIADGWTADVSATLLPTRSLSADVGFRHETLWRQADGGRYSSATIPRVQAQYQFTRALFVRAIAEYATVERAPMRDPASGALLFVCSSAEGGTPAGCQERGAAESHDVHVEALVTYEPAPGTVFYAGYTRNMRGLEPFRFDDLSTRSDGLFIKLSYRFRF